MPDKFENATLRAKTDQIIVVSDFPFSDFFILRFSFSDFFTLGYSFLVFSITDLSNYTKLTKNKNLRIKKSEINYSLVGGGVTKEQISGVIPSQA